MFPQKIQNQDKTNPRNTSFCVFSQSKYLFFFFHWEGGGWGFFVILEILVLSYTRDNSIFIY